MSFFINTSDYLKVKKKRIELKIISVNQTKLALLFSINVKKI